MAQSFTRRHNVLRLFGSFVLVVVAGIRIRAGGALPPSACFAFFGVTALGWGYLAVTWRPDTGRFQSEERRIVSVPGGFAAPTTRGRRFPARWARVTRASAYDRDRLTTDEIRVSFEADEFADVLEVPEARPGFQEHFGAMETEAGISPAWHMDIMTPALDPMHRVLFDRVHPAAPATRPGRQARERGRWADTIRPAR